MPRPKGGAAAAEDAPSTQQVRASVERTEALAERLSGATITHCVPSDAL